MTPEPTAAGRTDLRAALLAPSELPGSYTAAPTPNSPAAQLGDGFSGCTAPSAAPGRTTTATAVYQAGMAGPFVAEKIIASDQAAATMQMRALEQVEEECGHFGGQLPGGMTLAITISRLTFPVIDDRVVAFRLTADVPGAGAMVYAHSVFVQSGPYVVSTTLVTMETSPEEKTIEAIVRKAVAKVDHQLRGT